MHERRRESLWFVATQLVFVAALIHLALGSMEWLQYVQFGVLVPPDFRWPVFVASALVIFYGLHRALYADDRRPYYLAGIAVMLGYAGGYFLWHLVGHPLLTLGGDSLVPIVWAGGAQEAVGPQWFLDHLFAGPVEFFAIAVEVGAAVLLAVLYVTAPEPGGQGGDPIDEGDGDRGETTDDAAP